METSTTEKELIELEQRFWQALKDQSVDEATSLTDFPCLVTGPQGVSKIDREQFAEMVADSRYIIDRFRLRDVTARQVSDDVAVVGYRVEEDLTVEGSPVKVEAIDASTWIRRDGRWLCAQHSEALAGDPFGRDRAT